MNKIPVKKSHLVRFHLQQSLVMLALLLSVILALCLLLTKNFRLSRESHASALTSSYQERAAHIDDLLGNINDHIRSLQLVAQENLSYREQEAVVTPSAFNAIRNHPEGNYYHLDNLQAPLSKEKTGNLTGRGSISNRDGDFYREISMALNLTPQFQATAQAVQHLAWVYYLSANEFIHVFPWVAAKESRFSREIYNHEPYKKSQSKKNPLHQPLWTQPYVDKYGKGLMITCSAPVYDGDRFRGIVALDLTVDFLNSLIGKPGDKGGAMLLKSDGRQVLARPGRISSESSIPPTFLDILPKELGPLAEGLDQLPADQLNSLGSYVVFRTQLRNAPWQAVFYQHRPSLPLAFFNQLGKEVFILLVLLLTVTGLMMFLQYRNFVWPSEQFLFYLLALYQHKKPRIDERIPRIWKPWFSTMETIFQDNESMSREIRGQNQMLEQRVRERTAELDMINGMLREEIEERSKTEMALQAANQKLQELSLVDGLTGIANYRKFDQYLQQIWKQMARDQKPISIIMCDVDYFKQFNDTYGHQAGDNCLQEVAAAIAKTLQRPGDLVARYGGEEFIVILPGTDTSGARQIAERIQENIARLDIPHTESLTAPWVTFSIGLASMVPKLESTSKDLLKAADMALYQAKNGGRNRIIFGSSPEMPTVP